VRPRAAAAGPAPLAERNSTCEVRDGHSRRVGGTASLVRAPNRTGNPERRRVGDSVLSCPAVVTERCRPAPPRASGGAGSELPAARELKRLGDLPRAASGVVVSASSTSLLMPPPSIPDYPAVIASRRAELREQLAPSLNAVRTLTLEIGCGHGHFLTAYAAAHPDLRCLGLDIANDRIARALRKRDRARLANLDFVHADADDLLSALPEEISLSQVFVLFPDPWPKRRHHKNRLMQPQFLSRLAARCAPNAGLYFRTDYAPYFAEARSAVNEHYDWTLNMDTPWPFEHVTVFQARATAHESLVAFRRPAAVSAAG
jgi:tRNA (guanine-N7-)-methyltransferase